MKNSILFLFIVLLSGCASTISEVMLPVGSITSLKDIAGNHYKIISIDTIGISRDLIKIRYKEQRDK